MILSSDQLYIVWNDHCHYSHFTNVHIVVFRGLPFIPYLDSLPNLNRSSDGPVRLPIVDKYKVRELQLEKQTCASGIKQEYELLVMLDVNADISETYKLF